MHEGFLTLSLNTILKKNIKNGSEHQQQATNGYQTGKKETENGEKSISKTQNP